jgi:phosphohistidine phosphatase
MMRLTLLRHAQADDPVSDQQDWDRPLTKRGQLDAKEMTRRMKVQQLRPTLMLSSPAIRARQTAEVVGKCFAAATLQLVEDLYQADRKQLLSVIQEHGANAAHLLVIGHNPGISECADWLAQERRIDGMPTCAIVTMEFSVTTWQAIRPATGINVDFDYPQRPA